MGPPTVRGDGSFVRTSQVADGGRIGGRLAVEVGRLGLDRVSRRASIPSTTAGLDAPTMARLLGRPVRSIEVVDGTEGTTDRVRLAVTGDDGTTTVFVKMAAAGAAIRLFGNVADLGGDEVRFYRDIRPGCDIETPAVLGLDHDPRTKRFVLVLEDLAAPGVHLHRAARRRRPHSGGRRARDPGPPPRLAVGGPPAGSAADGPGWTVIGPRVGAGHGPGPAAPAVRRRPRSGSGAASPIGTPPLVPASGAAILARYRGGRGGARATGRTPSSTATRTPGNWYHDGPSRGCSTGRRSGGGTRSATSPTSWSWASSPRSVVSTSGTWSSGDTPRPPCPRRSGARSRPHVGRLPDDGRPTRTWRPR